MGSSKSVSSQARAFEKYEEKRYNLLARHTNWTAKKWRETEEAEGEVWLEPENMLKSGVVDEIIIPKNLPKRKNVRKNKK
jgi:ATP-dependent protease ClpP protease subunit